MSDAQKGMPLADQKSHSDGLLAARFEACFLPGCRLRN